MDCKVRVKKRKRLGKGAKCEEKVKGKERIGKEKFCEVCVKRQRAASSGKLRQAARQKAVKASEYEKLATGSQRQKSDR